MVKHIIVKRTYQSAINSRNVSDECISNFQRTHPAPIKKEQEKEIAKANATLSQEELQEQKDKPKTLSLKPPKILYHL